MHKNQPPSKPKVPTRVGDPTAPNSEPARPTSHTIRETVESVVIAFVLAFLFRTFEAEAFVIPTGSMAPTLQGRHKDIDCPMCGYRIRASASSEVEEQRPREVLGVTCPICRYTVNVDPQTEDGRQHPAYSGDRILVGKFPYEIGEPERWDVVVFRYPGDAKVNYIKRLVGKPQETVRIYHGDIYLRPTESKNAEFEIERKPPDKVRSMMQIVHDNDYVCDELLESGWPARWTPWGADPQQATGWKTSDGARSYETEGSRGEEQWIRYQHFVPSTEAWDRLLGAQGPAVVPNPKLITDFYAYNGITLRGQHQDNSSGLHWVGDLIVEGQFEVQNETGQVMLDLVEGGQHFRATIDVQTGEAQLSIDGVPEFQAVGQTSVRGPGKYWLSFANVDNQLLLWEGNGWGGWSQVEFDVPTAYPDLGNERPQPHQNGQAGDLAPVGIGSKGAAVKVAHMRVLRDVYYIADDGSDFQRMSDAIIDYKSSHLWGRYPTMQNMDKFFSEPNEWKSNAPPGQSPFDTRRSVEFELGADQFFVLGDNSPASKDSRLWGQEHWVDRELLIGKALYIYWPHSFDRIPGTGIPFPFFPNIPDMGLVR